MSLFKTPDKEEIEQEMGHDFSVEDPWNFRTSPHELKRFKTMLDFLDAIPHASILEVGCAEGFFTKMLLKKCDDVTAIDISDIALDRAKRYAPQASYIKSSLEEFGTGKKFDVIICSEVIYYNYDRRRAIENIKRYGKHLVASNIVLNGIRPCTAEIIFWRLPFPKFKIIFSLREMKITIITLRKL